MLNRFKIYQRVNAQSWLIPTHKTSGWMPCFKVPIENGYEYLLLFEGLPKMFNSKPRVREIINSIEYITETISDLEKDQFIPEIRHYAWPFNAAGTTYFDRRLGFWGPRNKWQDSTPQAVRMGNQLLVEASEARDAPWVRIWLNSHAHGMPELKTWLDNVDEGYAGLEIPKDLLGAVDLAQPDLERKSYQEWFRNPEGTVPYSELPEGARLAHEIIQDAARFMEAFKKMLEVSISAHENILLASPIGDSLERSPAIARSSENHPANQKPPAYAKPEQTRLNAP